MTTPPPPPPRLTSIVLGVLIVAVGVSLVCSASALVKWAGMPFLVLPRVLGLLEGVRNDEIVPLPMAASPTAVSFPRADTYSVYLADLSLLEIALVLEQSGSPPFLVIQRADTGESIPVEFVRRGLMPYDEPRVPGRPVFRFEVPQAGSYVLSHPRRSASLYLVPDRTTGRETLIAGAYVIQMTVLAAILYAVLGRSWRERRARWRAHQRERRTASEEIMRRRAEGIRTGAGRGRP